MARSKYVRARKTGSKTKSRSKILFKKEPVTRAEQAVLAGEYYDKHKQTIDAAINMRRSMNSNSDPRTNREIFTSLATDSSIMHVVNYGTRKSARRALDSLVDDIRGVDPNIKQIKRNAEHRNEAGFSDLRKLNKKIDGVEIDYSYGDVVGYFDIAGSDYVIAHSRADLYSTGSPIDIYEYVLRSDIGLATE